MKLNKYQILTAMLIILLLILAGCGEKPEIKVENAIITPSKMGAGVYSGFMEIYNTGSADTLVSFSIPDFPEGTFELHDVQEGKMTEIESIKIPASSKVTLERGNLHIMMFDLPEITEMPEVVKLLLNFEKSGEIAVQGRLEAPADHGSMPEDEHEAKH